MLAAFAGFTLAAGALGALRLAGAPAEDAAPATILRRQLPALATLDSLALRTVAVVAAAAHARHRRRPRPAASHGGARRRADRGDGRDLARLGCVPRAALLAGWAGRRAAYLALAGFALVIVVRLGLPVTHFA